MPRSVAPSDLVKDAVFQHKDTGLWFVIHMPHCEFADKVVNSSVFIIGSYKQDPEKYITIERFSFMAQFFFISHQPTDKSDHELVKKLRGENERLQSEIKILRELVSGTKKSIKKAIYDRWF